MVIDTFAYSIEVPETHRKRRPGKFMAEMFIFADKNPVTAFFIALIAAYVITWFPYSIYLMVCRYFRYRMVREHGWPTAPLMDADGDIVHPRQEDKD